MTETTDTIQSTDKPWQFQPGRSGNPEGRPKGALNKATVAARELLYGQSEAITQKAVELALEGDTTALRLCMERIVPALKSTSPAIQLDSPQPNSLSGTAKAFINAAASGDLAPDVAAQLVGAVAAVARVEEVETLKVRMEALEHTLKGRKLCK